MSCDGLDKIKNLQIGWVKREVGEKKMGFSFRFFSII